MNNYLVDKVGTLELTMSDVGKDLNRARERRQSITANRRKSIMKGEFKG